MRKHDLKIKYEKLFFSNLWTKHAIKIKINGKTIIIGASALVGILAGLGIGKLVSDKKRRERKK